MNRNEKNPRQKEFSVRKIFTPIEHKKDVAIQNVKMIDDDGIITNKTKEVLIDEREIISKIPPVTTKIEYIEQYGTIDKNGIIKYQFARNCDFIDNERIYNDVKKIVIENLQSKSNEINNKNDN